MIFFCYPDTFCTYEVTFGSWPLSLLERGHWGFYSNSTYLLLFLFLLLIILYIILTNILFIAVNDKVIKRHLWEFRFIILIFLYFSSYLIFFNSLWNFFIVIWFFSYNGHYLLYSKAIKLDLENISSIKPQNYAKLK